MKKLVASFLVASAFTATAAFGQLLVYDGFSSNDYTAGATVNALGGGIGWAADWSVDTAANDNNIHRYWGTTHSLGYTDNHANSLVTSPGGLELRGAGSGAGALNRVFADPVSGDLWFSFLNIRTTDSGWNYDIQFRDAGGGLQFRIQNDGNGNFRLSQAAGGVAGLAIQNYNLVDEFPDGQLFVGHVTNVGSGSADSTITVWVNPANLLDLSEGAEATASLANRQVDAIGQFHFDKGAATTGFFDELRVGASAGDVMPIPEPATYALWLGAVAAGVLLLHRRRNRNGAPW